MSIELTGFPVLTSANACLRCSFSDSNVGSSEWAAGGTKLLRPHEERWAGAGAVVVVGGATAGSEGAATAAAGVVDSADDDSVSESDCDELPELGLPELSGETGLEIVELDIR